MKLMQPYFYEIPVFVTLVQVSKGMKAVLVEKSQEPS